MGSQFGTRQGGTSSGCRGRAGQCKGPSGASVWQRILSTQRVHVVTKLASQAVPWRPQRACPRVTLRPRHCCAMGPKFVTRSSSVSCEPGYGRFHLPPFCLDCNLSRPDKLTPTTMRI
jgi:hypothetical protein